MSVEDSRKTGSGPGAALAAKIRDRSATVGVLGLGYVGLPLGLEIAAAGYPVVGIDPSEAKVASLLAGRSYVEDVSDRQVVEAFVEGAATATGEFTRLKDCDVIVVCVPTPLSKTKEPDLRFIEAATEEVARHLRVGQLVVCESTTYPGTTEELVLPHLRRSGLRAEQDFFLAFSPERVDPGNPTYGISNTPKVVGGLSEAASELACAFYGSFIEQVVPVSSPRAAEMVKLLENTFRAVNIGLINEIAIMCNKLGVDVWEVIDAARTKPFGFMPFYPGPGLGGHCIPVDPLYLGWKLRTLNYRARFIELADHVNSTMPNYVVFRVAATLNDVARSVRGSRILILGMAYKPGVSDVRESPALGVYEQLVGLGALVQYHDPHVASLQLHVGEVRSTPLTAELIQEQDLIILTTAHPEFDYGLIAERARKVLDTRNAFAAFRGRPNVVRL